MARQLTREAGAAPKYQQLAGILREQILNGDFPVGFKLPTVVELANSHKVSQLTAFRSMRLLSEEGLVSTNGRRKGTIVVRSRPNAGLDRTTIGCLLRSHSSRNEVDNFGLDIIQGIRDEISRHHFRFIYHCLDETDYEQRMLDLVEANAICGIILDGKTPLSVLRRISQANLPAVMFNRIESSLQISAVSPDYARTVERTVALFREHGYERVAFWPTMPDEVELNEEEYARSAPAIEMHRVFAASASSAGLEMTEFFPKSSIPSGLEEEPEGYNLPRRKPANWKPTGIMVSGDRLAIYLINAIGKTNLRLGKDIGVTGCFDLECNKQAAVPPSTWSVDRLAIGRATVQELLARIENPSNPPARVKISMDFVDRETA